METTAPPSAAARTVTQPRRLPLAQLLFAVAGVALLVVCGTYALRFISATAFQKERAFRVLEEIGSQLDNLQRTLSNQLRLMPVELFGKQCAQEFAGAAQASDTCKRYRDNYQRRLALQGPKVGIARVDKELFTRACGQESRYGLRFRAREPGVPFTAFACAIDPQPGEQGQLLTIAFQGSIAETLEGFVSQNFFDEVLVALGDGTVIATVPRRLEARSMQVQLHSAKVRRLGVANVASMLRQQSQAGAEKEKSEQRPASLPAHPEVVLAKIADENYRIFIRAIQPRYGTYVDQDDGKPALRQERLFLLGLKREALRAELGTSLEPGGRFLLTVVTLLAFLVWPLANLRSKSPDDPIMWTEAIACLAAVVLIPAVLAIATVWVWSYQGLLAWVDAGASRYARSVATTLNKELQEGTRLLQQYRSLYRDATPTPEGLQIPIRSREGGGFAYGRLASCSKQPERTCVIDVTSKEAGEWRGWTTFSSVFATDSRGVREGNRYTVYDPPLVRSDANYDNREYFRALQKGVGWAAKDTATGKEDTFVAQRLFGGTDGARVLQIAVPRSEGPNCKTGFCGIVTGAATFHSLAAAVSPPLLNFAVIDRNSGVVLFHSNDSRSLAENFFVETERNPQLLALTEVGQSGFFTGHYVGAGHRFFHLPMNDMPWSVVVFYSLKEVGDLSWHAVFTALAAYAGALLVVLALSGFAVWLWAKRQHQNMLSIAAGFWMRVGSSCSYARWALALFGIALSLVTVYEIWADGPVSTITRIMWVVLALATVAVLLQHRFQMHSACIALWLLLLSGVPAGWMALGYHDVQVQGLLRDGLLGAAGDIQRRSAVIAGDLHRWLSSGENRDEEFPPPWQLTRPSKVMPVPGYALGSCDGTAKTGPLSVWMMCVFGEPPLATLITRRELDFWRRETWDASVQAQSQQRRIRLLGRMNGWNPVCPPMVEACSFRTSEGEAFTIQAMAVADDTRIAHQDDDRHFDGIAAGLSSVSAVWVAMLITWMLSAFISRRLLGTNLLDHARGATSFRHGVLFYTRRMPAEEVEQLVHSFRPGVTAQPPPVTRVNVATKALYTELAPERLLEGPVLLTNLDIALVDAERRRHILEALERLAENPRVQLLILCRRSPIEQLYHPERYPEAGPQHVLTLDESLRWDNVLQKFECTDLENMDAPRTHPHLAEVDHHRIWKLCTRSERLLLYQLARGRLANPRNTAVIYALMARGLLKLDPWPKIADEGFENFVRTAETTAELAQWQQDAAHGTGRRVRSTILTILLVVLLLVVVWFSWSAGDKLKVFYAVVAGAVAFLGQIGQALNFVRTGAGMAGRTGS